MSRWIDRFRRAWVQAPTLPGMLWAHTLYERIQQDIERAQANINEGDALGVFCVLPGGEQLRVIQVGYANPHLMRFFCESADGSESLVLVHYASAQVILRTFRPTLEMPRRPIGFMADSARFGTER